MRVLIITGNMPYESPYIQYYVDILTQAKVEYDIVAWNRGEYSEENLPQNIHIYRKKVSNRANIIKKIWGYWLFKRFVIKTARMCGSNSFIIFTIPTALFYHKWLINKYKNRYIFDIRDYSNYYKNSFLKKITDSIIANAHTTCISSPGFMEWLPKSYNKYILSHNIGRPLLANASYDEEKKELKDSPINILTIGQIRDPEANYELVRAISADKMIHMTFVGYGYGMDILRSKVTDTENQNIHFEGAYDKKDEYDIVEKFDMINAYMPNNILSNTLMSNRFYLSVLQGKPILVSKGSTQAKYVNKYNLGVVIDSADNIVQKIHSYWEQFDKKKYNEGRKQFLKIVADDYNIFEHRINEFITNNK